MGFSNPRTPWSELARRLEGKERRVGREDTPAEDRKDAPAGSNARPVVQCCVPYTCTELRLAGLEV